MPYPFYRRHPVAKMVAVVSCLALLPACDTDSPTGPTAFKLPGQESAIDSEGWCYTTASAPSECGTTMTVTPDYRNPNDVGFRNYDQEYESANWQAHPITVTFNVPVDSVRLSEGRNLEYCESAYGYAAITDGWGVVDTIHFYDPDPTVYPGIPWTCDVSVIKVGKEHGIKKIVLYPAVSEFLHVEYGNAGNVVWREDSAWSGYTVKFKVHSNFCPPTSDSLLNTAFMRQLLKDLTDSANFDSVTSKRRERNVYIYRDSVLGNYQAYWPLTISSTPCSTTSSGPPASSGLQYVALVHPHPFRPASALQGAEVYPSNCSGIVGQKYRMEPSTDDWDAAIADSVPGYIIDKHNVVKYRGDHPDATNKKKRPGLTKSYMWNHPDFCRW